MLFCWCQASLNRVLLIHWLNQQSLVCSQRSWKDTSFHFRYHVCWGSICVEPTGFEWIRIKQMRIASIRYMNRYVWNDARWCGWYEMPPSWEKCHSRKKTLRCPRGEFQIQRRSVVQNREPVYQWYFQRVSWQWRTLDLLMIADQDHSQKPWQIYHICFVIGFCLQKNHTHIHDFKNWSRLCVLHVCLETEEILFPG